MPLEKSLDTKRVIKRILEGKQEKKDSIIGKNKILNKAYELVGFFVT